MRYFNQRVCCAFALLLTCFSTASHAQDNDTLQSQSGQEFGHKTFDPESGLPKNIPANDSLRPFDNQTNHNSDNNSASPSGTETSKASTPPNRRIQ